MNEQERDTSLTLGILQLIDGQSDVTQRHLAARLGIALGLANAYLKRCIRKGLIKVQQAPANRYLYYLTPQGFAEKSRLTALYLRDSFDFYRRAAASADRALRECERQGRRRLALAGASELAEIALLRARAFDVEVAFVYDPDWAGGRFLDLPVVQEDRALRDVDAVIVSRLAAPEALCRSLAERIGPARVVVPDLLGVNGRAA